MPVFYYTAKSQTGKTKSGTVESKDKHALAETLRREGFVLTSIEMMGVEAKKKREKINKFTGFFGKVSLVEKLMFVRHLSVMIGAGFSLHKGLEVLAKQTANANFKKILNDIVDRIKRGENLGDSLAKYPKVFNNFFVSMVRVGEKGGNLEEVLKVLASYLKKENDFKSSVKGAMVYPVAIIVIMLVIGIAMMVFIMPQILGMFEELNVDLPITTRILIAFVNFLNNYLLIFILIVAIVVFSGFKFFKTKKGKRFSSWFFLKTPYLGKITRKMNCAKFSRSLSSLMESGVPIVESLNIAAQTVSNFFYCESLKKVAVSIKKGKKIQEALTVYGDLYPVLVNQMIGVGEETGQLSEIMERLASFYEEEVKNITDNLASVIEPVLMVLIGAVIGFFAISMIQPMYSMMEGI